MGEVKTQGLVPGGTSRLVIRDFGRKEETKKSETDVWLEKPIEVIAGDRIMLPEGMDMRDAAAVLLKKDAESEELVKLNENITDGHPFEAAYAFSLAMQEKFGWVTVTEAIHEGMFGPEKEPPQTISVQVDHDKWVDVLWGGFTVPDVAGRFQSGANWHADPPYFIIQGEVKKKDLYKVKELADLTRQKMRTHSVYRGKALRIVTDDDGEFVASQPPKFLDLSAVNVEELTFSAPLLEEVQVSLWTVIERTGIARKHRVPLKRGILFAGPYGTGKTLTGYVTARKAIENGWTFVYCERVTAFREAVRFARRYAPAVVFAEDIDRILSGERDLKMDDVLNVIDGIDSKNEDIVFILTTNFVDRIDRAMLRPGRVDSVILVEPPDAEAVKRLMRIYGRGLIREGEDLEEAAREAAGHIPALIREVVERAKLYAIHSLPPGSDAINIVTGEHLAKAARSLKNHRLLLEPKKTPEPTTDERLGVALRGTISEYFEGEGGKKLAEKVAEEMS